MVYLYSVKNNAKNLDYLYERCYNLVKRGDYMKKLYVVLFMSLTYLFFSPYMVNAEDCSSDRLSSYLPYVNQTKVTYQRLGTSETFEIWASNVSGGIALEKGRVVQDEGFLGYASAGENVIIRAYVSDGSQCAGSTIKEIVLSIPKDQSTEVPIKNDKSNESDSSESNNSNNNDQITQEVEKPTINQNQTIKQTEIEEQNQTNNVDSQEVNKKIESVITENDDESKKITITSVNKKSNSNYKYSSCFKIVYWLVFLIMIILLIVLIYFIYKNKSNKKGKKA